MAEIYCSWLGEEPAAFDRGTCAFFTGHRDFTVSDGAIKLMDETLDALIGRGVVNFYAGGARGFDTFAEINICNRKAHDGRITLTLALPFMGYGHISDRLLSAQYECITSVCDRIVYLCPEYSIDSYQKRNMYMADRSEYCVSWQKTLAGGTANAVNYARRQGLKIVPLAAAEQMELDL